MAVKIIIERRVSRENERSLLELLKRLRVHCLEEPGYISGETLRDSEDPRTIVVISSWFGLMDWRRWSQSQARMELEREIRKVLLEPERVTVLLEGLSDVHSGT